MALLGVVLLMVGPGAASSCLCGTQAAAAPSTCRPSASPATVDSLGARLFGAVRRAAPRARLGAARRRRDTVSRVRREDREWSRVAEVETPRPRAPPRAGAPLRRPVCATRTCAARVRATGPPEGLDSASRACPSRVRWREREGRIVEADVVTGRAEGSVHEGAGVVGPTHAPTDREHSNAPRAPTALTSAHTGATRPRATRLSGTNGDRAGERAERADDTTRLRSAARTRDRARRIRLRPRRRRPGLRPGRRQPRDRGSPRPAGGTRGRDGLPQLTCSCPRSPACAASTSGGSSSAPSSSTSCPSRSGCASTWRRGAPTGARRSTRRSSGSRRCGPTATAPTSSPTARTTCRRSFALLGLDRLFDGVLNSADFGVAKPDLQAYAAAHRAIEADLGHRGAWLGGMRSGSPTTATTTSPPPASSAGPQSSSTR